MGALGFQIFSEVIEHSFSYTLSYVFFRTGKYAIRSQWAFWKNAVQGSRPGTVWVAPGILDVLPSCFLKFLKFPGGRPTWGQVKLRSYIHTLFLRCAQELDFSVLILAMMISKSRLILTMIFNYRLTLFEPWLLFASFPCSTTSDCSPMSMFLTFRNDPCSKPVSVLVVIAMTCVSVGVVRGHPASQILLLLDHGVLQSKMPNYIALYWWNLRAEFLTKYQIVAMMTYTEKHLTKLRLEWSSKLNQFPGPLVLFWSNCCQQVNPARVHAPVELPKSRGNWNMFLICSCKFREDAVPPVSPFLHVLWTTNQVISLSKS